VGGGRCPTVAGTTAQDVLMTTTAPTTTPAAAPASHEPALPFALDRYDRWDLVLIAPMLLDLVAVMVNGFLTPLPPMPFSPLQHLAHFAALVFLLRRFSRSWRPLLPWVPMLVFTLSALVAMMVWLWVAGEWGFFGPSRLGDFALWALFEEVLFRVVLIDMAYVAVRRLGGSHPVGAVVAVVVTGLLFIAQPGHIAQSGWTLAALSFFYSHLLYALPRVLSGVVLPGFVVHLTFNVAVMAGNVIPLEPYLRPGMYVLGGLVLVAAHRTLANRDPSPTDPVTGELLGPPLPPILQRWGDTLQARLAAAWGR